MWGDHERYASREEVLKLAWSRPMRDIAADSGQSATSLANFFRRNDIAWPPQGYWNKLAAGKRVPTMPDPKPRGPGETGLVRIDNCLTKVLELCDLASSEGPFASPLVPEELEDLRALEIRKLGRCGATRNLDAAHSGLQQILKREERRRERTAAKRWALSPPIYDNVQDQRRLKLFDAIFRALAKRGHGAELSDSHDGLEGRVLIGDTPISFKIEPPGESPRWYSPGPGSTKRLPSAVVVNSFYEASVSVWKDGPSKPLETQIVQITAGLIVAGEGWYRKRLKLSEEYRAANRRREEEETKERRVKSEANRIEGLRRDAELLREAAAIRALITEVESRFALGEVPVDAAALQDWADWAKQHADKIDPILSGAVVRQISPS